MRLIEGVVMLVTTVVVSSSRTRLHHLWCRRTLQAYYYSETGVTSLVVVARQDFR